MNATQNLAALYRALEEKPDDRLAALALADWYEEQGDLSASDCVRWVVHKRKRPYKYSKDGPLTVSSPNWSDGWYWWAKARAGAGWGHPSTCGLPARLWNRLKHT